MSSGSQHSQPKSDIDIARVAEKRPILEIGENMLGIAAKNLVPYGHDKAKISLDYISSLFWYLNLSVCNQQI